MVSRYTLGTVSDPRDTGWKLDELAEKAGVSARTVRYYVQRGLLPAPLFRGRDTVYSGEHLVRLRAIRRLQEGFLPLDAIQAELDRRTPDEVRALAEGSKGEGLKTGAAPGAGDGSTGGAEPAHPAHPYRTLPVTVFTAPDEGTAGTEWTRWVLAPGLELQLSGGADAAARALADWLRAEAARVRGVRGRGGGRQ